MHKHYTAIANGLFSIASARLGEKKGSVKVICYMMAQIAEFLHGDNVYDRDSARLYFESDEFYKHCAVLAINDTTAHHILTRPPRVGGSVTA